MLQTLGIVYVWPVQHSDVLRPLLQEAIIILSSMIDPPNDDWGFLDMWGNDPDVIAAVHSQIEALELRLSELPIA